MNLLPPTIIRRRQYYTLCLQMAAVQAVIFLLFILSVWFFDFTIRSREIQAMEFDMKLQDERFIESEAVAMALREYHIRGTAQQEIAVWLELPHFDMDKLDMVKETLPAGVVLLQMDMDEDEATLTLWSENLSLSDIHRDAWLATGLVSRVRLVSATVTEDGAVQYTLTLRWKNES